MGEDVTIDETYTVDEASKILGVSKNAVRKRVQRGSLPATKVEGQWRIFLQDEEIQGSGDDRGVPQDTGHDVGHDTALEIAQQNLTVFRDAFVLPLVEQIAGLERERGRLEAENRQLREKIEELEAVEENEEVTSSPWWRRLLGM